MDNSLIVTALVIAATNVGDNDKRLVLLTRERGKLTAFANGARRPTSHLMASSNPLSYGTFELYEGRSSCTLKKASITEFFENVRKDLDAVMYASFFLEVTEFWAKENLDESQRLLLLYQSLRALSSESLSKRLVTDIFLLRTMVINGDYPNVFSCMDCGTSEELKFFSCEKRGALCPVCAKKHKDAFPVSSAAMYAMKFIESEPIAKLFTFRLSEESGREVTGIISGYRKRFLRHDYRSEGFLPD